MVIANQQRFLLGALHDDKSTGDCESANANTAKSRLGSARQCCVQIRLCPSRDSSTCPHVSYGISAAKCWADARFCHVLDARKSGLRVRSKIKRSDKSKYGGALEWRKWKKSDQDTSTIMVVRDRRRGTFIVSSQSPQNPLG
jgi:hypothetical protein